MRVQGIDICPAYLAVLPAESTVTTAPGAGSSAVKAAALAVRPASSNSVITVNLAKADPGRSWKSLVAEAQPQRYAP